MKINSDILATVLKFLGISKVKATTDNPEAQIHIEFYRYGQQEALDLTCQQIIEAVQNTDSANKTGPARADLYKESG